MIYNNYNEGIIEGIKFIVNQKFVNKGNMVILGHSF